MTLPQVTPVPHVIRGGTVGGDVLNTDVNLITMQKLPGHASVHTTTQDDRPVPHVVPATAATVVDTLRRLHRTAPHYSAGSPPPVHV